MKAFLGTGLLGSNFVKAMLKQGEQVQVWNRSAHKAKALEASGAKAFEKVEEAVKNAEIIHLTLKDDASVEEVLNDAEAGIKAGAIIADHTTTSAAGVLKRIEHWKQKGVTYIHAPVFMGPGNALESTGIMLISGDQSVINKIQPELEKMTGKLINVGEESTKAAALKLVGNCFLIQITTALSDSMAVAGSHGLTQSDVLELFSQWNINEMVPARLKRLMNTDHNSPSWELQMARKDAGLMMDAANSADIPLVAMPAIADAMDKWIANGHGNKDWSIIVSESVK